MTRRGGAQGASQRQLRVGEQIRHTLADLLLRGALHDPAIEAAHLAISEVRVSRDLRQATVFATELGGALRPETEAALTRRTPFLRGEIARRCHLKYAPALTITADTSFDHAARIEALLARERDELDRRAAEADGA